MRILHVITCNISLHTLHVLHIPAIRNWTNGILHVILFSKIHVISITCNGHVIGNIKIPLTINEI